MNWYRNAFTEAKKPENQRLFLYEMMCDILDEMAECKNKERRKFLARRFNKASKRYDFMCEIIAQK